MSFEPFRFVVLMTLALLAPATLAAEVFEDASKTGAFNLTFTKRSDLSTNIELCKRMGWDLAAEAAAKVDYVLSEESFEVYIPADYTGDKPYGLFVFCSPSPSGRPMGHILKSLDEHHLIYVGPNKAGNDRVNRHSRSGNENAGLAGGPKSGIPTSSGHLASQGQRGVFLA